MSISMNRYWLKINARGTWHEVSQAEYNQAYDASFFTQYQTGEPSPGFKAAGIEGCYTTDSQTPPGAICSNASELIASMQPEVHPKADFQKEDCFSPDCPHTSSLEVRLAVPPEIIQIRCCERPQCVAYATKWAIISRQEYHSSLLSSV